MEAIFGRKQRNGISQCEHNWFGDLIHQSNVNYQNQINLLNRCCWMDPIQFFAVQTFRLKHGRKMPLRSIWNCETQNLTISFGTVWYVMLESFHSPKIQKNIRITFGVCVCVCSRNRAADCNRIYLETLAISLKIFGCQIENRAIWIRVNYKCVMWFGWNDTAVSTLLPLKLRNSSRKFNECAKMLIHRRSTLNAYIFFFFLEARYIMRDDELARLTTNRFPVRWTYTVESAFNSNDENYTNGALKNSRTSADDFPKNSPVYASCLHIRAP